MVSVITAWGVRWTGLSYSPKSDSDRLIKDNRSDYAHHPLWSTNAHSNHPILLNYRDVCDNGGTNTVHWKTDRTHNQFHCIHLGYLIYCMVRSKDAPNNAQRENVHLPSCSYVHTARQPTQKPKQLKDLDMINIVLSDQEVPEKRR